MIYRINEKMEYIQADDTALAVYNPNSGETHLFDESGIDILNAMRQGCDFNMLQEKLCEVYNVTKDEIQDDLEEFLAFTISKGIVITE